MCGIRLQKKVSYQNPEATVRAQRTMSFVKKNIIEHFTSKSY